MVVHIFDTLPQEQTLRLDVGAIAPRPSYWVVYTAKPLLPVPTLAPGNIHTALHRPWIPEAGRLPMHALTRIFQQLRLKVKEALLRGLHQASLYRRLIIVNTKKGARTESVGIAL